MSNNPRRYSDTFILSLFLLQILRGYSYRETLEEASRIFSETPSLSDYHYRVKNLSKELLKKALNQIGCMIGSKGTSLLMADGTEFSFNNLYPLKMYRGVEVRKAKSHVRLVPIVGVIGNHLDFKITN